MVLQIAYYNHFRWMTPTHSSWHLAQSRLALVDSNPKPCMHLIMRREESQISQAKVIKLSQIGNA